MIFLPLKLLKISSIIGAITTSLISIIILIGISSFYLATLYLYVYTYISIYTLIILIVGSAIIFFTSFLAIIGIRKTKSFIIFLYSVTAIIVIIIFAVVGILSY
jgi:predicted ABC-type exoprotein transport system permease subunit